MISPLMMSAASATLPVDPPDPIDHDAHMCRCRVQMERTDGSPGATAWRWTESGYADVTDSNTPLYTVKPGESRTYNVKVERRGWPNPPAHPCVPRVWVDGLYSTSPAMAHYDLPEMWAGDEEDIDIVVSAPLNADASSNHGMSFKFHVMVGMFSPGEGSGDLEFRGYCDPNGGWDNLTQDPYHLKTAEECVIPIADAPISEGYPPEAKPYPDPAFPNWMTDGVHPYDPDNTWQEACESGKDLHVKHHTRGYLLPVEADFTSRRIEERAPSQGVDTCFSTWVENTPAQERWDNLLCEPFVSVTHPFFKQQVSVIKGPTPTYTCPTGNIECPPLHGPTTNHSHYGNKASGLVFDRLGRPEECIAAIEFALPNLAMCDAEFDQEMLINCGTGGTQGYKYVAYDTNTVVDQIFDAGAFGILAIGNQRGDSGSSLDLYATPAWNGCGSP